MAAHIDRVCTGRTPSFFNAGILVVEAEAALRRFLQNPLAAFFSDVRVE